MYLIPADRWDVPAVCESAPLGGEGCGLSTRVCEHPLPQHHPSAPPAQVPTHQIPG